MNKTRLTARSLLSVTLMCFSARLGAGDGYGDKGVQFAPSPYAPPADLLPQATFGARILPMPGPLAKSWGGANVNPRVVTNGIEDPAWSYWCSCNFTDASGLTHFFTTRWKENGKKGHNDWPSSEIVYATGKDPAGPFTVKTIVGGGHNVTRFRTKSGKEILYRIGGAYEAPSITGPWKKHDIRYDLREAPGVSTSNHTFAEREDGSVLMVSRGGHVWISEDGEKPFFKITRDDLYPPMKRCLSVQDHDHFEDPCVWRDEVQYNLLVNDWYGRTAFYLRSADGIRWVWDEGVAFAPQRPVVHADGSVETWHKYERPNVHQDAYGRATHLYLAAIDAPKEMDKPGDGHSSKVIVLPLVVGKRMRIAGPDPVVSGSPTVTVTLLAEPGFDPAKDVDFDSLRFGAPSSVDYGKGAKLLDRKKVGSDVELTFATPDTGLTREDFAAKLLGKTASGGLLYAFGRTPAFVAPTASLTGRPPRRVAGELVVPVENFGTAASAKSVVRVTLRTKEGAQVFTGEAGPIPSYGRLDVKLTSSKPLPAGECAAETVVDAEGAHPEKFGSRLSSK